MSCYHPVAAFRTPGGVVFGKEPRDSLGDIEIACGRCLGCRLRRSRDWGIRAMHEASLYKENCFVTLTYEDNNLPEGNSLDHRDYELFMKRMRDKLDYPVRFFMCGEYGPLTLRPHYHALLFGHDFKDRKWAGKSGAGELYYSSQVLSDMWQLGFATVQDLTSQTAAYCTRYCVDKMYGDPAEMAPEYQAEWSRRYEFLSEAGEVRERKREYCACSLKPGIGAWFYALYGRDKSAQDFVVMDGERYSPPKYYDKLADREGWEFLDEVEFARQERAKLAFADNTPERLQVREVVHAARVKNLKREF